MTTTERSVLTTTKQVLGKMMRKDPESISDTALLFAGLGLKSADVLEMLMGIENELGIRLDPSTLDPRDLQSVETISRYVATQTGL